MGHGIIATKFVHLPLGKITSVESRKIVPISFFQGFIYNIIRKIDLMKLFSILLLFFYYYYYYF